MNKCVVLVQLTVCYEIDDTIVLELSEKHLKATPKRLPSPAGCNIRVRSVVYSPPVGCFVKRGARALTLALTIDGH